MDTPFKFPKSPYIANLGLQSVPSFIAVNQKSELQPANGLPQ